MKPVTAEEYKVMQEKQWQWARDFVQNMIDDERPAIQHTDNRPIISIKQMLDSSVQLYENEIAFYTKFKKGPYEEITYRRFYDDVNGFGTALISLGLKEKKIAVVGESKYTWNVAYLGVVCGTGVVVPLDKELPYEDLKNLIKEADVAAVITDKRREKNFIRMMEDGDTSLEYVIAQDREEDEAGMLSEWSLIEKGRKMVEEGDRSFLDAQIDNEETSIIIFTSGTTGMAKGVMLSHKNICADVMAAPSLIKFDENEVFFSVLPIHHTYECTCNFIIPLYKGSKIAHCEGLKYIVKNMQEIHPSAIMVVPAVFEALNRAIWKGIEKKGKTKAVERALKIQKRSQKLHIDLSNILFKEILETLGGNMRVIICGGAAINPDILDTFNAFGILSVQGYGLSECSPLSALNPEYLNKYHSCGITLPGFGVKIEQPDENGIGEICLSGDNIMLGYYKNPEATAEVLKDGWFYTGDLGYVDVDGYIVITGRKKNVIITKNGKNVFPEELEHQLLEYDEIMEAMVFEDQADGKNDDLIVAGIYPDWVYIKDILGDKAEDDEEVRKYLWSLVDKINDENPGYKMIKRVNLRHTEFEKNTSKKIKRFVEENKKPN